jgi:hypothetical protein
MKITLALLSAEYFRIHSLEAVLSARATLFYDWRTIYLNSSILDESESESFEWQRLMHFSN